MTISIQAIGIRGIDYSLPVAGPRSVAYTIPEKLDHIRSGGEPDHHGWNFIIEKQ